MGPSHESVRNDFPGQTRPIERSRVVTMSSGVAVLKGKD